LSLLRQTMKKSRQAQSSSPNNSNCKHQQQSSWRVFNWQTRHGSWPLPTNLLACTR
jgi:hypothetical protein